MSIDKLKQKFSTGAFISDVKHYFSKINEIIDYLNNNPITTYTPPYLSFTALVTHSGGAATLTLNVLNSDIGNLVFNKQSNGYYKCDLTATYAQYGGDADTTFFQITDTLNSADSFIKSILVSGTILEIYTFSLGSPTDNLLLKTPLEIRIYK